MRSTALSARDSLVGLAETPQNLKLALAIVTIVFVQRHHTPPSQRNQRLPLSVPDDRPLVKYSFQALGKGYYLGRASQSSLESRTDKGARYADIRLVLLETESLVVKNGIVEAVSMDPAITSACRSSPTGHGVSLPVLAFTSATEF